MSTDLELSLVPSSKSFHFPAPETIPDTESNDAQTFRGGPRELENFREAVALPPVDRGYDAWMFVFCSFVLDCLVWGLGFT